MSDPTAEFLSELSRQGHEVLLEKITGTVRFDLDRAGGTDHWLINVHGGDLTVSEADPDAAADAVFHTDRSVFDQLVTGQANALSVVLRGAATVAGDANLLVYIFRLVPGRSRPGADRGTMAGHGGAHG